MLRTMVQTFLFRLAAALLSFGLVMASTRYLGAEGRGVISLALTGIGIIGMLSGFMGGSSLVYLFSRSNDNGHHRRVMWLSGAWAVLVSASGTAAMRLLGVIPQEVIWHVMGLGLMASILAILSYALLSAERIAHYNILAVLQVAVSLAIFGTWPLTGRQASVGIYLAALYISYALCLILASVLLLGAKKSVGDSGGTGRLWDTAGYVLRYGLISQAGLVIQFLNYRLAYFFLDSYAGTAAVGIYSVAALLAESIWMFPGSIALVLYARISSRGDSQYAQETTITLAKLSQAATLVMLAVLLAIPSSLLAAIFGRDFSGVGRVILCLAPGILALSYSMIINHFLAGIGLFRINTLAAAIGLAVTITGNILLVPRLGLAGAALTSSAAYTAAAAYAVCFFLRHSGMRYYKLLPNASDLDRFRNLLVRA